MFVCLALSSWFSACEPAVPTAWGEAGAPNRLELGVLRLRPAASVGELPTAKPKEPARVNETPESLSRSIGPPQRGELLSGVELVERPELRRLPNAIRRQALWGTAAMVGLVERAAAVVAEEYAGSTLWVGDISKRGGGPFAPHASHQSGRDVDLAFYLTTADGVIADPPQMAAVDRHGRVRGLHFDLARNWRLIEAMLDDEVAVQWIFIAGHLKDALLAHGRAIGSPFTTRAERVLFEPRDSSPHADHYHVRIYCGLDDRLAGCLDAPPFHPWVDRHDAALERWLDGLLPFLEHPHRPDTDQAIEAIVRMNATAAIPALLALAEGPDDELAALARDAASFLSGRRSRDTWERWRPRELGH